jgi:hypothetical protein
MFTHSRHRMNRNIILLLSSDAFDNLVYTLLPLFVVSAYKCEGRIKAIVGKIEAFVLSIFIFGFPPLYNFFVHEVTSKFDYVCMILASVFFTLLLLVFIRDSIYSTSIQKEPGLKYDVSYNIGIIIGS